jgi:prevent-host-death family protein
MIALSKQFVTVREASNSFSQVVDRAHDAPQVVTRNGKPAAVVIDPELFDAMQQALETEAESLRILADAAAVRADAGQGIPVEEAAAWLHQWRAAHGLPAFDPATADPRVYLDDDAPATDH